MKPILAPILVAVALLFIALAIPLIKRRVKPNYLYGLRIPATFADEWVWYEANARSGQDLVYLGAIQIAAALLLLPLPDIAYAIINGTLLVGGTIAMCVVGIIRASRLLKERRATSNAN